MTSKKQNNLYNKAFYLRTQQNKKSAKEIIPLVLELVHPKSVIDIGCGVGAWLKVFNEFGINDIFGVDSEYVDKQMLEIPEKYFLTFDLKKPLHIKRKFDLVVSLEIAEHLPIEYANTYVDSLTMLGPIILFAAAIPYQGGTYHINEQWPEYWMEMFRARGYTVLDCLRKKIWQKDNVKWWYVQNILLYVRQDYLKNSSILLDELKNTNISQLSIVHPKKYLSEADPNNITTKKIISLIVNRIKNTLRIF